MTVKQFFKSNAFKCIAVLFAILLISGVLLTIAYGFMEVSAEEKLQRAISKIYGKSVTTTEIDLSNKNTSVDKSTINSMYLVEDDGNYLLKVTGKQGYGGNVVCWVVIETSDDGQSVVGVGAVTIDSAPGESFISKISAADLERFSKDYTDGIVYKYGYDDSDGKSHEEYVETGASKSYRAVCNAVNGAVAFVKAYLSGVEIEAPALVYLDYISSSETYWQTEGGSVDYTVVTLGNGNAAPFTIEITVGADAKITSYEIIINGSTSDNWVAKTDATILDGSFFTGKSASDLEAILIKGEDEYNTTLEGFEAGATTEDRAHATKSTFLCLYAALFATANYDYCSTHTAGGNA